MKKIIRIGSVSIPLDSYVIGGTALLGIRDSGKTYAAKGIAEQLLALDIPIVVFDPIGRWRFMKLAGDDHEKPKGYKVVVAGGAEPDLPLTPQSAPEIVRAAVRENIPLILDFYDRKLSKADWRRIVQSCFRTLLYENEGLRHIFLEETAEFAPQKVLDGETYAEVEKLVRMGGNVSLGITLINQRAQEVNKAILDLCENLVLMRQRGSHAIDSIEKWMDKLAPNEAAKIAKSLPHMRSGDAWVFTGDSETPVRTRTSLIRSFHPSRRTPALTAKAAAARSTDTADFVSRLTGKLETVVKEAEANDPKKLRARIAELERQVKAGGAPAGPSHKELQAAEQRGLQRGLAAARETQIALLAAVRKRIEGALNAVHPIEAKAPKVSGKSLEAFRNHASPVEQPRRPQIIPKIIPPASGGNGSASVSAPQQKLLDKLAWLEEHSLYPAPKETLAAVAGVSPTSGGYFNNLGALRSAGFIEYPTPGEVGFTAEGRALANPSDDPRPVHEHWLDVVTKPQRAILEALIAKHPDAIEKDALAEELGVSPTSGGYFNNLGRLRTLGAIDYPQKGHVALTRHVIP